MPITHVFYRPEPFVSLGWAAILSAGFTTLALPLLQIGGAL